MKQGQLTLSQFWGEHCVLVCHLADRLIQLHGSARLQSAANATKA